MRRPLDVGHRSHIDDQLDCALPALGKRLDVPVLEPVQVAGHSDLSITSRYMV